ncbi:hypothetical protein Tsubulata_049739 [Turnera subulata]|uniref:DUF7794 domain-containing protein n=1 Tax=Turnera subulata TaxID=218843 RepID=A0A9Q0FPC6_9ROSI|nr:hypothetical protein Tsubulata_049739 [Turnera subulata]
MDTLTRTVLHLLLVSALLCSLATAESAGFVLFIDGKTHRYLRSPSPNDAVRSRLMSIPEIGAAVSVLLGFVPPATLSAAGSAKLNEVLKPNPFDRPRAVFALEVSGIEGLQAADGVFRTAFKSKVVSDSDKVDIELPGDEVSVVSLDEGLADFTDKEISDFAYWLGGSYASDVSEALNGELTIPLASGSTMNLHLSKKAEREFIAGLLALFRHSRSAIELHEDLSQSTQRPAELIMGRFDGIKVLDLTVDNVAMHLNYDGEGLFDQTINILALQEQYGTEGVVQQGMELFSLALSKMIDLVQDAYKGQIVGVIFSNGTPLSKSETLNVVLTSRPSARWLEETKSTVNETLPEVARVFLVRKTLAWVSGIILIISTLLGIHFLLNMPLTRDTLLYSNVKLD